jgi:hypothetical protein
VGQLVRADPRHCGAGCRRAAPATGVRAGHRLRPVRYDITAAHNLAAGEQVRWLPRRGAAGLLVPCSDFWVFDDQVLLWNHFAGDGFWVGEEKCDDPAVAKLCAASFDAA